MDWSKLFALLVAVASIQVTAEAPKKKIRIHLPQKVKHIHHHKKIYITNYPASSQYAPAFMPSAENTVALPTNVGVSAVASVLPINSVELYDESPTRMPRLSPTASKLLPLYRARGYYGPTPTEWEEQDYDIPAAEPTDDTYLPNGFTAAAPTAPSNYPPKRVKLVKLNDLPRKKAPRKTKPKRVPSRNKPLPQVTDDEHPVTTFHEQFYSDIGGSGTIRKLKKPPRVEKIIDGDTEHIHTYNEEHIHKLVFDDGTKVPGVVGIDSVGSMSALAVAHPLVPHPLKKPQTIIAIPPDAFAGFNAIGSLGTPSQVQYTAYNPREVTHDHIFHDHGEIPSGVDLSKDRLPFPPGVPYTNHGLRTGFGTKLKNKHHQKYLKSALKPTPISDFSYYENVYAPYHKYRNMKKPTISTPYEQSHEANLEDYRPVVTTYKLKNKGNVKSRNILPPIYFGRTKPIGDLRLHQDSGSQTPNSISTAVIHDYKPKHYAAPTTASDGFTKLNRDIYNYANTHFGLDTYPSSPDVYATENYPLHFQVNKGKKKSISTQNISFGGLDHQTTVDHLDDSGVSATSLNGGVPSAFDNMNYDQTKTLASVPATVYTIRDTSPAHPYFSAMAVKAFHNGDQLSLAEASNDNYQYAEAPSPSTTPNDVSVATTVASSSEYFDMQSSEEQVTEPTNFETRPRSSPSNQNPESQNTQRQTRPRYKVLALQPKESISRESGQNYFSRDAVSVTGKLKYGDKI